MATSISSSMRAAHRAWLFELTQIPTATGKEWRVEAWIERWVNARPGLRLVRDDAGNMVVSFAEEAAGGRPVYFTAHMDHPAFVVERVLSDASVEASFRGGVMDEYFDDARVVVFDGEDGTHAGVISKVVGSSGAFKHYVVTFDAASSAVRVGDVGVWGLPAAEEIEGCIHTHACDDLAAAAGAVAAMDVLYVEQQAGRLKLTQPVRLLFTRAEEVGFIGAIAACKLGTMPKEARVIALENSRSFAESPIGGGPIVRVGDRVSVFSPSLTDAIAKTAEGIAGAPATPRASEKASELKWKWQRKLMAGGACEASVFCAAGYEATCVCLPLGNYHNMADLAAVQAGTNTSRPRVGREYVSLADFDGLVDLLVGCAIELKDGGGVTGMVEKLWGEKKFVLEREGR